MTQSVFTLTPSTTIEEAVRSLSDLDVSGAPVCDDAGKVLGVFTKTDVVRGLGEGTVERMRLVSDLMTKSVAFVREEDDINEGVRAMASQGLHRLIVLNKKEELIGIVTPIDILKAIAVGRLLLRDPDSWSG